MNKEDWLRKQMLKVAPEENRRMREVCNTTDVKDPWAKTVAAKKTGSKGGRPFSQDTTYRDYFLKRTEDVEQ